MTKAYIVLENSTSGVLDQIEIPITSNGSLDDHSEEIHTALYDQLAGTKWTLKFGDTIRIVQEEG